MGVRTGTQALRLLDPAATVEDRQLGARQREAAVLVLGVEAQQRPPDRAQVRHGGRAAVDQGPRAAIGADPAGEHHLALLLAVSQQLRQLLSELPNQVRGSSKTPST